MKLYYSDASPYARKVRVVAHETGAHSRMDLVSTNVSPVQPNKDLSRDNPLMKLPTLVADDGTSLFDSPVICQYLASLNPAAKLMPDGMARWRALRLEALADGVTDAAILCRQEATMRPEEKRWQSWSDGQMEKVNQGLDLAEREAAQLGEPINLGQIALACCLGWMELRKVGGDIRGSRPKLFAWYDRFAQRPSMVATAPKG